MKLTLTLEEEIVLSSKYRISFDELMTLRTLLLLQDDSNEELFKSCIECLRDCNVSLRKVLLNLQDKGIILKSYDIPKEGVAFNPYTIPINKTLIKNMYKSSFEMGKELFEVYPQFATINGNLVPLRTVAKRFDSLEDCYYRYGKEIRWNSERHEQIVELVKWARDNDILNCSLSSFIINNGWNDLQSIKDGGTNINLDSVKMI